MARHNFVRVPEHPRLMVSVSREVPDDDAALTIVWNGAAEDFVRAGVASAGMLAQPRGEDADGHMYGLYRIPAKRAGKPRFQLRRCMPEKAAMSLAGVAAAYSRYLEHGARMAQLLQEARPLAQVLCLGGELKSRDRPVGRWQRHVRWIVNGNLIAPDWREVRSGYARGIMPKRTA